MKSGICSKCGARDVRLDQGPWSQRNYLAPGFFAWGPIRIENYVCAVCGYLESYVRSKDLEAITKSWPRVGDKKVETDSELV